MYPLYLRYGLLLFPDATISVETLRCLQFPHALLQSFLLAEYAIGQVFEADQLLD